MRNALILVALLGGACSKKSATEGLPPATEWNANTGETAMVPMPGTKQGLGGDPGEAVDPSNPHAGLGIPPPPGHDQADPSGSDDPHAKVVAADKTPAKTLDKLPNGDLVLGPFAFALPKGWSEEPVSSSMRAAAFKVGADAELIIFYFGKDGAGSIDDNLARWVGQFSSADGKPTTLDTAKVLKVKVAGQDATTLSVNGHLHAMAMPGASDAIDKADQAMLGMIVASPNGPYYWKLVGPKATIEANAAAWKAVLDGLKLKS